MTETFETLYTQASAGDATSQYRLGNVYQMGYLDQAQDIDKAIEWYQLAADQGHGDAAYNLGVIGIKLLPGMNRPPRPDIAIPALQKACKSGDEQSCCLLADTLLAGEAGVPADPARGKQILENLGRKDSTTAMNKIGLYLMEGQHIEKDERRANAWFKRAANLKDPEGRFNLAISLLHGHGIEQDDKLARRLIEAAAKAEHPGAMFNLAVLLYEGRGGPANDEQGNRWLLQAAEAGYPDAQFEAGQACRLGRRVPRNEAAAVRWYEQAARQNHMEAQFCLGICFQDGVGTGQNPAAAENCYTLAAQAGHAGAAHNLAIMYIRGEEIPQDLNLGKELLEYAIALGEDDALFSMGLLLFNWSDPESAYMWGLLSKQHRPDGQGQALLDRLESELSEEQKTAAQSKANDWERPQKTMVFHIRRG